MASSTEELAAMPQQLQVLVQRFKLEQELPDAAHDDVTPAGLTNDVKAIA
jgi:hypothetical protein